MDVYDIDRLSMWIFMTRILPFRDRLRSLISILAKSNTFLLSSPLAFLLLASIIESSKLHSLSEIYGVPF